MTGSNQWAIELEGEEADRVVWKEALTPPGDPYVEEVDAVGGTTLALRATAFGNCDAPGEVRAIAVELFRTISGVMAILHRADTVTPGPVIDLEGEGSPKRHYFINLEAGHIRLRGGSVNLIIRDAEGNVVESPSADSETQEWMRAATLCPGIAETIGYLHGSSDWGELYKAYETLRDMGLARDAITSTQRTLFTRSANTEDRHRKGKFDPPTNPMPLREGRTLMERWLAAAITEWLLANPR